MPSHGDSIFGKQIERQPRLGIALMQMPVKRGLDYEERLQSFALERRSASFALYCVSPIAWARLPRTARCALRF